MVGKRLSSIMFTRVGGSGLNLVLRFAHICLGHVYRVGNYGILETNIFKQLNVRFPCVLS